MDDSECGSDFSSESGEDHKHKKNRRPSISVESLVPQSNSDDSPEEDKSPANTLALYYGNEFVGGSPPKTKPSTKNPTKQKQRRSKKNKEQTLTRRKEDHVMIDLLDIKDDAQNDSSFVATPFDQEDQEGSTTSSLRTNDTTTTAPSGFSVGTAAAVYNGGNHNTEGGPHRREGGSVLTLSSGENVSLVFSSDDIESVKNAHVVIRREYTLYFQLLDILYYQIRMIGWTSLIVSSCTAAIGAFNAGGSTTATMWAPYIKAALVLSPLILTLLTGWMKINNFLDRVAECEKHLISLESMKTKLDIFAIFPPSLRDSIETVMNSIRDDLSKELSHPPKIYPTEIHYIKKMVCRTNPGLAKSLRWRRPRDLPVCNCCIRFCCCA